MLSQNRLKSCNSKYGMKCTRRKPRWPLQWHTLYNIENVYIILLKYILIVCLLVCCVPCECMQLGYNNAPINMCIDLYSYHYYSIVKMALNNIKQNYLRTDFDSSDYGTLDLDHFPAIIHDNRPIIRFIPVCTITCIITIDTVIYNFLPIIYNIYPFIEKI